MSDEIKDNLIAARALIDTPEKWHKGSMSGPGCLCAMGAVAKVIGWSYMGGTRIRSHPEVEHLRKQLPTGWWDVPKFNDAPETTHADIMALFDRAIAAQDVPA